MLRCYCCGSVSASSSKILIAFLISFFPMLINAYAGFGAVDDETAELARSMRVGPWTYFCRFQFPHALPRIFSGARIAINFAVVGAVVGEFVGSDQGLGNLVILAARLLNSPLMFSAIVMLMAMGALFFFSVGMMERWTIPVACQLSTHGTDRHQRRSPAECLRQMKKMAPQVSPGRQLNRPRGWRAAAFSRFASCSTDSMRAAEKSSPRSITST